MSLAAVRRENTSASNVFVFVCVFSSLPPAPCTAAAFLLSGQHSYVVGLRRACMAAAHFLRKVTHKIVKVMDQPDWSGGVKSIS